MVEDDPTFICKLKRQKESSRQISLTFSTIFQQALKTRINHKVEILSFN